MKLQHRISNPMTVIAIFAALSETSAAVSLPFLDNREREIYVWFLISFPFYLLFLFFITLNFNYRSLYAPSDFEKGKHFIRVIDDAARAEKSKAPPIAPSTRLTEKKRSAANRPAPCAYELPRAGRRRPRQGSRKTTDPPIDISVRAYQSTEFHLPLPKNLKKLQLIDARSLSNTEELHTLISELQQLPGDSTRVMLFLIDNRLAMPNGLNTLSSQQQGQATSFYMIYNVSTLDMTRILRG